MSRSYFFITSVLTVLLFFSGCAKQEQVSAPDIVKPVKKTKIKSYEVESGTPKWVYNPNYKGHTGVIGYAKPQKNKRLQKRIALIVGKARISEQLKINIEDMVISYYSQRDNIKEFHSDSRQTSSNVVKHVIVKDEYTDSNGVLYLWLVTQQKGL